MAATATMLSTTAGPTTAGSGTAGGRYQCKLSGGGAPSLDTAFSPHFINWLYSSYPRVEQDYRHDYRTPHTTTEQIQVRNFILQKYVLRLPSY